MQSHHFRRTHRFCIEALERTLRDIRKSPAMYSGVTICFSGDWRQCGPLVPFGSAADTVEASFFTSQLWPKTVACFLQYPNETRKTLPAYASFVRSIGENKQPTKTFPDGAELEPLSNLHDETTSSHFCLKYTADFNDLINFLYPEIH